MKAQYVTELPFGYDEQTIVALDWQNNVIATHPVMPPIIYDESVMRWVEVIPAPAEYLNG